MFTEGVTQTRSGYFDSTLLSESARIIVPGRYAGPVSTVTHARFMLGFTAVEVADASDVDLTFGIGILDGDARGLCSPRSSSIANGSSSA